uniref:Uncharacterized protein n=1 Tax=Anopheles farauti TaxID=69004 RepID=A0A182QKH0_9DIPT
MEKQARKHADISPAAANGAATSPAGGNHSRSSSSNSSSSSASGSIGNKTKKNNNPIKKEEKDTEMMARQMPRGSDSLNPEHEMFMQAFEKPTQIYRFLRTRNVLRPIFLYRNLTYMRNRMSRSHKSRQSFKIDAMLAQKLNKLRTEKASGYALADGYLTLVFLGFYDDKNQSHHNGADSNGIVVPLKNDFDDGGGGGNGDGEASERKCVQVETNLLKVAHTKRKDVAAIQMQLTVGKSNVLVNPRDDEVLLMAGCSNGDGDDDKPVVSIPTDSFTISGPTNHLSGPQVSFILRFRVHCTVPANDEARYASDDGEEPSAKRQKLHTQSKLYSTELTVFDKLGRCLLTEADYELTVREIISQQQKTGQGTYCSPIKNQFWTSLTEAYDAGERVTPGAGCSKCEANAPPPTSADFIDRYTELIKPTLKIRLQWTKEPPTRSLQLLTHGPDPLLRHGCSDKENHKPPATATMSESFKKGLNLNINNNSILTPAAEASQADVDVKPAFTCDDSETNVASGGAPLADPSDTTPIDEKPDVKALVPKLETSTNGRRNGSIEAKRVIYHFIHNNYSRQVTENGAEFMCPWCCLDCCALYSLLKHLKLCHARFNFNYVPGADGARIDVTINELYDGSYNGSPHDLLGPSKAFMMGDPLRRTVVTNLLVCRPRRPKPSLSEFIDNDETEFDSQRPYITGHSRMYHHTMTCLPVYPRELDIDSEGESDPLWLQHKTMQMIDEFTDVNEGEKELMKMWNLHVMKYGYVGDCQIPIALEMFIDLRGRELMARNLYRNFVLHMCSMFDFGLVSADVMQRIIRKLRKIPANDVELQQSLKEARSEQMNYWNNVTVHKKPQPVKSVEPRNGGGGERTGGGAGASTSTSGGSSYHLHHKAGHGHGTPHGSSSSTAGDGQQRKVKPTITPAKNTDTAG